MSPSIQQLVDLVRADFQDWNGFDHPGFQKSEVSYKQDAVTLAGELLAKESMRKLVEVGNWEELTDRFKKVAQRGRNLLYLAAPSTGDLSILFADNLEPRSFFPRLFDLLHGDGDSADRLSGYLEVITDQGLPNKWTFPTFYLFMLHPETEIFIKPSAIDRFLKLLDPTDRLKSPPAAAEYRRVRGIAELLREELAQFSPRDMVDIQGFIWVCQGSGRKESLLSKDQRQIIQDFFETSRQTTNWQEEVARRLRVSKDLQRLVRSSGILEGGILEKSNLAEMIRQVGKIQALQAIALPILIGNYDYNVYFKGFEGTREQFVEKVASAHPDWEDGSTGHEGADLSELSAALCGTFTATSGAAFVDAFGRLLDLPGVGPAFATGVLVLWDPQHYALVNGGACEPFERGGVCELTKAQLKKAKFAACSRFGVPDKSIKGQVRTSLGWIVVFDEVKALVDADDFLEIDLLLWSLAQQQTAQKIRCWKIAPGEGAWNWDDCRGRGYIGIGWEDAGDLTSVTREDFEPLARDLLQTHEDWTKAGLDQLWKFARDIRPGDRILANRGTTEVLGIGTVTGPYYFAEGERHGHRLPVSWDDVNTRQVDQPGWKRTLIELTPEQFQGITEPPQPPPPGDAPFSARAFELLGLLERDPQKAVYDAHKDEFHLELEAPFQQLMRKVAEGLPQPILDSMETENRIFARIPKNDWGRGGAWPFYWGAFYPKGGKRIEDAQLFVWMNHERLGFGFFIGEYGSEQRKRFVESCAANRKALQPIFSDYIDSDDLLFGSREEFFEPGSNDLLRLRNWRAWLEQPASAGVRAGVEISRNNVLRISRLELERRIQATFARVFPLVLLATADDAMPRIAAYLGMDDGEGRVLAKAYTLLEFATDTNLPEPMLERWVQSLERKGQAVFYGPPGTGKTYIAERMARHLVGGGDGFYEIVQFHPAYAYEDFIQGIRPRVRPEGSIDFRLEPGRFLDFCARARKCQGTCVLIIDEINRANLSRVFGELMYLLEYRDKKVPLAGGNSLEIPSNVRVIGTMNTADRSIALVDHALRRRFAFIALYPQYEVLRNFHADSGFDPDHLIETLRRINSAIGDRHYEIGISFFLRKDLGAHLQDIWRMEIEPYLEEYFFDQASKVDEFRWEKVADRVLK